jgi:DNA-binding MarR family transcriptional regulator
LGRSVEVSGFKPSDLFRLPPDERRLLTFVMRHGESSAVDLARHLALETGATRALAETLEQRGLLSASGAGEERRYCAVLGTTRR